MVAACVSQYRCHLTMTKCFPDSIFLFRSIRKFKILVKEKNDMGEKYILISMNCICIHNFCSFASKWKASLGNAKVLGVNAKFVMRT